MADYTGGYTGALESESRRAYTDTRTAELVNALAMLKRDDEENQRAIAEAKKAKVQGAAQLAGMLNQAPGGAGMPPGPPQGAPPPAAPTASMAAMFGPQSPMPGQSSQPMQQPRPAPPGGAMAPGGPMPPPAPAAPMEPWKAMPGAPAAAPGQMLGNQIQPPKPQEAMEMIMRGKTIDPMDMFKTLVRQGSRPEDALAQVEQMAPLLNAHNKGVLDDMRIKMDVEKHASQLLKDRLAQAREARLSEDTESKITSRERRLGLAEQKAAGGGKVGKGGGGGAAGGVFTPQEARFYALQALGGDQSWRTGLSRYKGGSQAILQVDKLVPQIAEELLLTPQDVGTKKAQRVALTAALKQREQFVASANQFVNNMQSQADLVEKYMTKGTASGVPALNKWIQSGRKELAGDPDVTALDTAIRGLAREHQRIVTGVTSNAQLHVSAQETADKLLNKDMTIPQIKATINVMREEAQNAIKAGQQETKRLQDLITELVPSGKKTPGATNSKGWQLMTDKNGNQAYVSPDGKQFEEVK